MLNINIKAVYKYELGFPSALRIYLKWVNSGTGRTCPAQVKPADSSVTHAVQCELI